VWKTKSGQDLRVREVWQENLDEEMEIIRNIVDDYPYLAMDTEFPGVVARPVGPFKNSGEYHYQTLRCVSFLPSRLLSHSCFWILMPP
jgi:CCR4-NOT transcription complex subunit 7/8